MISVWPAVVKTVVLEAFKKWRNKSPLLSWSRFVLVLHTLTYFHGHSGIGEVNLKPVFYEKHSTLLSAYA